VQVVEGTVSTPLIRRHTLHLPLVLTILSQIVFGLIFGLLGVALAAPFTARADAEAGSRLLRVDAGAGMRAGVVPDSVRV
jgi:NhaP-type Na+/H+ and K+/H+ antiporter